jgi:hypothetical protein
MKVYHAISVGGGETVVDLSPPCLLLDYDGRAIRGNVLDVDSQGFPDPQPGSGTNDEQHAIEARGKPDNPRNYFTCEARRLLFLLVYRWHVDELVIPFPGVNLLPLQLVLAE